MSHKNPLDNNSDNLPTQPSIHDENLPELPGHYPPTVQAAREMGGVVTAEHTPDDGWKPVQDEIKQN